MNKTDTLIWEAFSNNEIDSPVQWTIDNCVAGWFDLKSRLNISVAPIDLKNYITSIARNNKCYNLLVQAELVRILNEHFPKGYNASDNKNYGNAAGFSSWMSMHEPKREKDAEVLWTKTIKILEDNPIWCPTSIADSMIQDLFSNYNFETSNEKLSYEKHLKILWDELDKVPVDKWSDKIASMLPGYRYLYGTLVLEGEVDNGGFQQYFDNNGKGYTIFAIEGYRKINRHKHAILVQEALYSWGVNIFGKIASRTIGLIRIKKIPRSLEKIDNDFYSLSENLDRNDLELKMTKLINSCPELFK